MQVTEEARVDSCITINPGGNGTESNQGVPLPPPSVPPVPSLREGDLYHVFISYSSTDYRWTHSLIRQLEACGLGVCYHERDFTPGRTVLENMSDCIHESQKVLLVLSSEFVRSRWCLLEANMSLFRDCLGRKPIVPVLLEPGVSIPLHLCHLTYLQAGEPDFFRKLVKVLCTPNRQLQGSTVVPFLPPSIYNGKALQPLIAVNEEGLHSWDAGQFSDMDLPDQLRLVIEDQEKYRRAVRMINNVYHNKVWLRPLWLRVLLYFLCIIVIIVITGFTIFLIVSTINGCSISFIFLIPLCFFCGPLGLSINLCLWKKDDKKHIVREMQKAVGQANTFLVEDKVLMGCRSSTKLFLVYVSLNRCRRVFTETFPEPVCAGEMFQRALLFFSSGYACCLAKRHFPFPQPSSPGHVEGGVCFCQYVSHQLSREEWK